MSTAEHKHSWQMLMHMDTCHSFMTSYKCACGAQATKSHERDIAADPWSAVWMEETYEEVTRDEKGRFVPKHWEPVVCQRCNELSAGATPRSDLVIVAKDGTIEREEHKP